METPKDVKYWSFSPDQALEHFNSSKLGLATQEAEQRLKTYGENSIGKQKRNTQLMLFVNQFKNPIIIILIIATLISAVTGNWIDSSIILGIIVASAALSFSQEYSASNAIEELRAKVQSKSFVIREGKVSEIPSKDLVPGDVIQISAGSLVGADALLLESSDLFINQAILTGESFPAEKNSDVVSESATVEQRTNCIFMGTSVNSGSARALIVKTGEETEFGQIAAKLKLRPPETDFESGVRHFGYMLTQLMLVLTIAVFAINVILKRPAIEALLFSVALAVGITPQLLPAIISITLSKGSRSMAKEGVIVRRLTAIENFGGMDILCTDKTGTLTEGTIRLDGAFNLDGEISDSVFRMAYINSTLQSGMANSLDKAISEAKDIDISSVKKYGEIPFDFTRKRLSIIIAEDDKHTIITKGALKNVLGACNFFEYGGILKEKSNEILEDIEKRYIKWSQEGIRVLGVSMKNVTPKEKYGVEDENDMVFMGFLLMFDHPKEDVSKVIKELEGNGVNLRVITGDNKLIALHAAEAVGLEVMGVITGEELMNTRDEALWNLIESTNIFAEVDPNQKERIILALKKNNHVVGYMGDGINDVPALHAADVSISVDNAVDVAKESADFVLMQKSLGVLNRGIELGRMTFSNTLKYIQVTTSANFGNMFSMAGASLFLPFLPLLPKQILLINFLTDFPAITIANDSVDADILAKPRRWNIKMIRNFMFTFGLISSIFDYIAFAVLFIVFKADEGVFQSSWFIFSIITELLILMVMRTQKAFYKSKPAPLLLYSSIAVGIFTMLIPYMPFHEILNINPINPMVLISLFGIAFLYIIITEIAKHYFYKD